MRATHTHYFTVISVEKEFHKMEEITKKVVEPFLLNLKLKRPAERRKSNNSSTLLLTSKCLNMCGKRYPKIAGANLEVEFVALGENPCSSQQNPDSNLPQQSWVSHQQSTWNGHGSDQDKRRAIC